ncbi:MAG TPA: HipA domain-containing protein [Bacteroidia bacterium]|jgi:serine/threonine-protein kinase HipA|nr:HipA domain-containing protein [Bacteroidia bacterium]
MKINRCLYCYKELSEGEIDFHPKCSKVFFGTAIPPSLSLTVDELNNLAKEIIKRSVTIPGVQPKLSLSLTKNSDDPKKSRLTIVGLWGEYILKPQSERFDSLPENEDLVMHLAEIAGIDTAQHSLLRTDTGQLAYITKRFDRIKGKKVPMEDFCQLAEVLSANKYKSTMEKAGALITKYASPSVRTTDLIKFFDIALFSFMVGNSDMHLKNFSIIKDDENQYRLSPAYDLLSSNLAMPSDQEQSALHIHGKKNRIRRTDFFSMGTHIGLPEAIIEKTIAKYNKEVLNKFEEFTSISFLTDELKERFIELMKSRFNVFL